ncbi:hypothetical protein OS493_031478 [Desmophyllum pertusum]|uniref:Uncharacterized protein n=1 Tax=Desmophyllum pertusum TaxID=174260 RepID=A0A9X0D190_9CNID|nr:hypothetical protein OS493_031478 [Desmophyllum pertusum]
MHAPLKKMKLRRTSLPWITPQIRHKMYVKDVFERYIDTSGLLYGNLRGPKEWVSFLNIATAYNFRLQAPLKNFENLAYCSEVAEFSEFFYSYKDKAMGCSMKEAKEAISNLTNDVEGDVDTFNALYSTASCDGIPNNHPSTTRIIEAVFVYTPLRGHAISNGCSYEDCLFEASTIDNKMAHQTDARHPGWGNIPPCLIL